MTLYINMFEYEGKPFANGLQAYMYTSGEEIDKEKINVSIGNALKDLDIRVGNNSAVAQFLYSMYCVPFDPGDLPREICGGTRDFSFSWKLDGKKTLVPTDSDHREIIRRLVANAIAKKQIQNGWFVERYGFAYHWSFTLSKELRTAFMEVYPGFVYRPYVYEDGSCAIMIDPKFKFMPKKNLRDLIEGHLQKKVEQKMIKLLFEGDFIIDACPIIECPHRKNPSSDCWLKGAGRRRKLVQLDFNKSPLAASIGDLREYRKKRCKFHGRIADIIADRPPIALVEKEHSNEFLEYPIERLREELKLHKVHKWQRLLVMKYIQPSLDRRWKLTENFAAYVDDLTIGRLHQLELTRSFAEAGSNNRPWESFACFEEPPLKFGNQACSYEPFSGLKRNGPYDLDGKDRRKFDSLRMMILNLSHKLTLEDVKRFYNDLVNGFTRGGSHFVGMKKIFRLEISKFSEDLLLSNISEIKELDQRQQPDIILVPCRRMGDHKIRHYGPFKQKLTRKGVLSQFILEDKLGPRMTPSKYASYLKNMALTIYYKVGGIPWVIGRPVSSNTCFIGLAMVTRRDTRCMSMQIFDSFGLWLGGWTEFIDKDEYSRRLVDRIREAQDIYAKEIGKPPSKTILHKDGEMWTDIEIQPIIDAFQSKVVCVSVKKTVLPRMYDHKRSDYVVKRGSYVRIDDNAALLATSGPPHPIPGSQRPITVEIKGNEINRSMLMNICEEIFDLSLVFGGYRLSIISKPITTHFASKALSLASKYKILESPLLWRKAWFV
ncbi:MAG: hypothetical protein AOA66_0178 [Candidatus Bathyarchaeota archaeon BA2]|nr:MAG: hypothetical protein AOA66_0178 [Candidatus Bathyarchaeota archaeon BA2]